MYFHLRNRPLKSPNARSMICLLDERLSLKSAVLKGVRYLCKGSKARPLKGKLHLPAGKIDHTHIFGILFPTRLMFLQLWRHGLGQANQYWYE